MPTAFHLFLKQDCPTCQTVEPAVRELAAVFPDLTIFVQDDPSFLAGLPNVQTDTTLEASYRREIEIVPTLIRLDDGGVENGRLQGWNKQQWRAFTQQPKLGERLPDHRPGCGSKTLEPGIAEKLAVTFGGAKTAARQIELGTLEDEIEACFARGWSDGLPVVPPTPERVIRMLGGTKRDSQEVIGLVPPNRAEVTVEKIAINAVLAGCLPDYLPVVIAAVEAALMDDFCMHGLLATTYFSGPMAVVNGPIARKIGMNSGGNALGQGNRANATIGRALQLVIRNVGGGRPGGVDRAALGNPGKYTFCFAEAETTSPWESLAVERGFDPEQSTVTLFAGDGVQGVYDQQSRRPESLAKSFAACLQSVAHPKLAMASDAFLIVSPEHARVFAQAGWSKAKLKQELSMQLIRPRAEMMRGARGIDEGVTALDIEKHATVIKSMTGTTEKLPKFRPGGLNIVQAGGTAGLFSAIVGGWVASGERGSVPVTAVVGQ